MKINRSWLNEWIDSQLDTASMGQRLTMAGLELEGIEPAAPEFTGVVVAEVTEIVPHPDADKLRVCQVSSGDEVQQVICGAANARQGLRVALARVGAKLPGDFKIKRAKLRGIESLGMLCSESELGLAEQSDGIMELPEDATIGKDIRDYLELDDEVMDIDLTPNRADCLSVCGVARELSALTGEEVTEPEIHEHAPEIDDRIDVAIEAASACPRYVGRLIRDVDMTASTPLWMQERLRRCGLRSMNPVVDVTNYVMLELGQPMHAFDADKLNGGITVRMAGKDETLKLLDEKEISLDEQTLVIADDAGPIAMAGVMGGFGSAITDTTTNIFLESAFFKPSVIAGKARSFGLHTDASHRFERGVDFELQCKALARASELIQSIAGGKTGAIIEKVFTEHLPSLKAIQFRPAQVERRLGIQIEPARAQTILTSLGCLVDASNEQDWSVIPPSFRFDCQIEVDLIEEIARIYGYDNIVPKPRDWSPSIHRIPEAEHAESEVKNILINLSYQEVITYSFADTLTEELLHPDMERLELANPISTDLAVMRTTLWGGLLKTLQHHLRRQQPDVRIFESGLTFRQTAEGLLQKKSIAGLISGQDSASLWATKTRSLDFYDIKGDLERLLELSDQSNEIKWETGTHTALHPGQSATLMLNGNPVGYVGQLHPQLQKKFDLSQTAYLFELQADLLNQGTVPEFKALSRFPSVRRDLSLLIDESVSYAQISKSITDLGNALITSSHIFDVYQGKGVASGLKSLSLGLILQDFSRTLEEQDVNHVVTQVVEQLNQDVGARLRD